MELLDFVQSIGGHIAFSSTAVPDKLMVSINRDLADLRYRPYPGGSGSLTAWGKIRNGDLNAAYEDALADLADTLNSQEYKVGFTHDELYVVPELTHTRGYRPKARKAKVSS